MRYPVAAIASPRDPAPPLKVETVIQEPETSIRELFETRERGFLSPHACPSAASLGRAVQEDPPCPIRTAFQLDRDRIVYSNAFRRLKHKTQVFLAPLGDHYRTRLTHTLEVAQMARAIARAMRLNEDLTEAISLGHDLGHTPFGHAGETALKEVYDPDFSHNRQSLRIVEELGNNGRGLNLTFEVRDGILKHSKGYGKIIPDDPAELPGTSEGRVVRIADIMAYLNHDLDDAIRSGVIGAEQVPPVCVQLMGRTHSERATTMIRDLVFHSGAGADGLALQMSEAMSDAMGQLRKFLYTRVYRAPRVHKEFVKAKKVVSELFTHFAQNEALLFKELDAMEMSGCCAGEPSRERLACDLVASMTDRSALSLYTRLFFPSSLV
jgi:dGTPase